MSDLDVTDTGEADLQADTNLVPAGLVTDPSEDARAAEYERRNRSEMDAQFSRLKDEARAIYGLVKGRPGVRSPQAWADHLEEAGDDIGNGRFLVRHLGAEHYLAADTVAVLLTLRQNLIAELDKPSTAKIMQIDAAIVAYYNMLRVQEWIGNLSLVFERECFGQETLSEIHGPNVGDRLEEQLRRLAERLLPLQDRCHRMMARALNGVV